MESKENCGVCGKPLIYGTVEVLRRCDFCGKEFPALIYCPDGHYVCDLCHSRGALDILRDVLNSTAASDPADILETVMSHPSVPMHGPEHHAMVPAIIVAAVKNAGYPVPEGAVEKALEKGVRTIGFSGGAAVNGLLASMMRETVEAAGLRFLVHEAVPAGDGGVSFGQAVVGGFSRF